MSRKGTYKMPTKSLQFCLVLVSIFRKLVEFSRSRAAQLLKLRLQTKPYVNKKYFDNNLLLPLTMVGTRYFLSTDDNGANTFIKSTDGTILVNF